MPRGVLVDIDGTLVDSNYQHALCWYEALRAHDQVHPLWIIHRHIGMGGDQMVPALAGERFDREHGDEVRAREHELYAERFLDDVVPMPGARELLERLRGGGREVVLASSARPDEVEHYVELLDAGELISGHTDAEDVEQTKPEPDLVLSGLALLEDREGAVMVGDSSWDCEAAKRAGIESIGVLTGGFAPEELRDAGARAVLRTLAEVAAELGVGD